MEKIGPIILIDDDMEDLETYKLAFDSLHLKNEILLFQSAEVALAYLKISIDPCFFILCDINMPKMNGIELRAELNKENFLSLKSIPFLFFSTSSHISHIFSAYNSSIQGYFQKPTDFKDIQLMFKTIVSYWGSSLIPVPSYFAENPYPKNVR
ncbi:MAG: response regulator [Chitinophagaceae bacterium]